MTIKHDLYPANALTPKRVKFEDSREDGHVGLSRFEEFTGESFKRAEEEERLQDEMFANPDQIAETENDAVQLGPVTEVERTEEEKRTEAEQRAE